jgi:hypothetical protein
MSNKNKNDEPASAHGSKEGKKGQTYDSPDLK